MRFVHGVGWTGPGLACISTNWALSRPDPKHFSFRLLARVRPNPNVHLALLLTATQKRPRKVQIVGLFCMEMPRNLRFDGGGKRQKETSEGLYTARDGSPAHIQLFQFCLYRFASASDTE